MKLIKRPYVFAVIYALILVSFTLYTILDTFVIAREYGDEVTGTVPKIYDEITTTYKTDSPDYEDSDDTDGDDRFEGLDEDDYYHDENITIIIKEYREYNTTIYVADVEISSAAFIKSAFAKSTYGKNITDTVSDIASQRDAIFAVNGDYYGAHTKGYVVRNGILYRDKQYSYDREDLVIYGDGSFGIITEGETDVSALMQSGALQVYSFGPALVVDGAITVDEDDEVKHSMASNPRTAVGIIEPLHYLFVVSDGRTDESEGLTLYELAGFMQSLGADVAYNLDGGGSSTMYFKGRIVNIPTDGSEIGERKVSDIVYIGYH